jgi:hypothetical protein
MHSTVVSCGFAEIGSKNVLDSYSTSKMGHGWPTGKQLTIDDHNDTSVVKLKNNSAIARWHQVSWIRSHYGSNRWKTDVMPACTVVTNNMALPRASCMGEYSPVTDSLSLCSHSRSRSTTTSNQLGGELPSAPLDDIVIMSPRITSSSLYVHVSSLLWCLVLGAMMLH